MALPFPRLELQWRKTRKDDEMDYYEWACDYVLLTFPANSGDARCNKEMATGTKYSAHPVKYVLNTSYRNSTEEPYAGDTPYRDGAHAAWDGIALNVPVYSRYKGKVKRLKPNQRQIETAETHSKGN